MKEEFSIKELLRLTLGSLLSKLLFSLLEFRSYKSREKTCSQSAGFDQKLLQNRDCHKSMTNPLIHPHNKLRLRPS
jgi:hypothetical protein